MEREAPIDASTPEGMALLKAEIHAVQKHNRRVLRAMSPLQTHLLERRLRTGRRPIPPPRVVGYVAPRTREHRPAAARRTSSSSTTSSADPGDSAGDGEPPADCEHCGPREICWSTAARAWLCFSCAEPFLQIGVGTWAHEDVADGDGGGMAS